MKKKIIFITLSLIVIDFVTKLYIDMNFNLMESIPLINNFFYITKVNNYGASWSILSGYIPIIILITFIVLVVLFKEQKKFVMNKRNTLAFSFIYSGIIGNLIDRLFRGYVLDFLDFKIFGYDYPVFNFADIFIVCGIILLIIAIIKKEDENGISSTKQ